MWSLSDVIFVAAATAIIAGVLGLVLGMIVGFGDGETRLRDQAIRRGAGQYDPKTGLFRWIDNP